MEMLMFSEGLIILGLVFGVCECLSVCVNLHLSNRVSLFSYFILFFLFIYITSVPVGDIFKWKRLNRKIV